MSAPQMATATKAAMSQLRFCVGFLVMRIRGAAALAFEQV
jgi:hypothetical protein